MVPAPLPPFPLEQGTNKQGGGIVAKFQLN